ncbi:MAG: ATP-binding cassette domain-containing protein [Treponema sp.]|nr:ATP-binding cassette domain-containing protein [Treponema sp.]
MDIETISLTKAYPLKTALHGVSVQLKGGCIHALVGENGAGKSTLANMLAGSLVPTSGSILLDGREAAFASAADALERGIVLVRQRPLLSESLSAWENITLKTGGDSTRKGFMGGGFFLRPPSPELLKLKDFWCPTLKLKTKVRDLGGNMRFYISLIGSLMRKPSCLILDEPSAFLSAGERTALYAKLREYADNGMNVIVITHSYSEAVTYPDTVSLLKDGELVRQFKSREEYKEYYQNNSGIHGTAQDADQTILQGQDAASLSDSPPTIQDRHAPAQNRPAPGESTPCLRLCGASVKSKSKPALLDATIEARYGEITAVTGVKEAAMETLEDLLTGLEDGKESGSLRFTDRHGRSTEETLSKKRLSAAFIRQHGGAIVPSDKNYRASNPALTVLQMLSVYATSEKDKKKLARSLVDEAGIAIDLSEKCSALSGGMLQRLILARELSTNPDFLILCNPMHGLDIASQGRLCRKLETLASQGKAILLLGAEDFPLSRCSRVYGLEGGMTTLLFAADSKGAA